MKPDATWANGSTEPNYFPHGAPPCLCGIWRHRQDVSPVSGCFPRRPPRGVAVVCLFYYFLLADSRASPVSVCLAFCRKPLPVAGVCGTSPRKPPRVTGVCLPLFVGVVCLLCIYVSRKPPRSTAGACCVYLAHLCAPQIDVCPSACWQTLAVAIARAAVARYVFFGCQPPCFSRGLLPAMWVAQGLGCRKRVARVSTNNSRRLFEHLRK